MNSPAAVAGLTVLDLVLATDSILDKQAFDGSSSTCPFLKRAGISRTAGTP